VLVLHREVDGVDGGVLDLDGALEREVILQQVCRGGGGGKGGGGGECVARDART
jgi:hypothetical protein